MLPGDLTGIRSNQSENASHRSGLSGSIGPQESQHLAGGYREGAIFKSDDVAETFVETVKTEHEVILARMSGPVPGSTVRSLCRCALSKE